jgi:hypothetical protein
MTERPAEAEVLTRRLDRLVRRANAALLVGIAGLAAATIALIAPYSSTLRTSVERAMPIERAIPERAAAPADFTADDVLRRAGLLNESAVLSANEFLLHDGEGRKRATLTVDENEDVVRLQFFDNKGKVHAALASTGSGALLGFSGGDHSLFLSADGPATHLTFLDRDIPQLGLQAKDDAATLSLGAEGKAGVNLYASDEGTGLALANGARDLGAVTVQSAGSSRGLEITAADGKKRIRLGLEDDAGSLSVRDKDEKVRASLGSIGLETVKTGATEQTAESSLVLFGGEGHLPGAFSLADDLAHEHDQQRVG